MQLGKGGKNGIEEKEEQIRTNIIHRIDLAINGAPSIYNRL